MPEPEPESCPECIKLIYVFEEGGGGLLSGAELAVTGSFGGQPLYTPSSEFGDESIPKVIYKSGSNWVIGLSAGLGSAAETSEDCPISSDWSMSFDGQYYTYECGDCDCITGSAISDGSPFTFEFRKFNILNGRNQYIALLGGQFYNISWDGSKWVFYIGETVLAELEEDTECPLSSDAWGNFVFIEAFSTELCAE